jgi:hypothetical protein
LFGILPTLLPFCTSSAYIAPPMARPKPTTFEKTKIVAENRRAKFDYAIETVYEAGIALTGTEGEGRASLADQLERARVQPWQPLQP